MRRALAACVVAGGVAFALVARAEPKRDLCFDVTYAMNSRGTNAVFERRHLQGGGPTWAAILETVVRGYRPSVAADRYRFDDEGDAVQVCAADAALRDAVRADYKRLNGNAKALEAAIDRVPPGELE